MSWASLSFFGLSCSAGFAKTYHWAAMHCWIATAGASVLSVGIGLVLKTGQPITAIVGSLVTFASMLLFGVNFL